MTSYRYEKPTSLREYKMRDFSDVCDEICGHEPSRFEVVMIETRSLICPTRQPPTSSAHIRGIQSASEHDDISRELWRQHDCTLGREISYWDNGKFR